MLDPYILIQCKGIW